MLETKLLIGFMNHFYTQKNNAILHIHPLLRLEMVAVGDAKVTHHSMAGSCLIFVGFPVFLPHLSSKPAPATGARTHGGRQAEALLAVATWREKTGQQQPVAMHVNERFSVASGGLMKHVRIVTALCSAVGHLHIMMYGGLCCIALICPC